MNKPRQKQWQVILQLTQDMLELAVPNESLGDLSVDAEFAKQPWQTITEIETKRLELLNEFFSEDVSAEDASEISDGIQQIQLIDNQLLEIGSAVQKDIGSAFSNYGKAHRAVAAYSNNAK